MNRCYTFNEWFGICGRLESMYWACWRACEEYAEKIKDVDRGLYERLVHGGCTDKCEEGIVKYALERYGLGREETILCMHLSGPA